MTLMPEASTPEASMTLIRAFCLCGSSVFFRKWVSQKCAPPCCVTRYACLPSWEVLRSRTQPCLCYKPVRVNPDTPSRQTCSYLGSARSSMQASLFQALSSMLLNLAETMSRVVRGAGSPTFFLFLLSNMGFILCN